MGKEVTFYCCNTHRFYVYNMINSLVIVVLYLYKGSALLTKASRSSAASPALYKLNTRSTWNDDDHDDHDNDFDEDDDDE